MPNAIAILSRILDADEEAARRLHRRTSSNPLPSDMTQWPRYIVASRLPIADVRKGLERGLWDLWRNDNLGRTWLRVNDKFFIGLAKIIEEENQ